MKRMIKTILFTLTLLCLNALNGQNCRLAIGLGGGLERNAHAIKDNPIANFDHFLEEVRESSIGAQVGIGFGEKSGFRGGVFFARKEFNLIYDWVINGQSPDPAIPVSTDYSFGYIEIPASMYYSFLASEKLQMGVSGGLQASLLVIDNQTSIMGDGTESEITFNDFNAGNFDFSLRPGVFFNYFLSSKLFLSAEPYLLFKINEENMVDFEKSRVTAGGLLTLNLCFFKSN